LFLSEELRGRFDRREATVVFLDAKIWVLYDEVRGLPERHRGLGSTLCH